jgi:hypothetical protein
MQPNDPLNPASAAGKPAKPPGLWQHIQAWDGKLSVAKGLTVVTLLTGFLGGYFQYLNAYEDKVREQAKTDMTAATQTFLDITNAFAEAQMLQQLIYFDYAATLGDADPGNNKMVTQAGQDTFPAYSKARNGLRQNTNVFARKAEIYIDWASNLSRDPTTAQVLDKDPLTEALLGDYNFNCDIHFPHFGDDDPNKAAAGSGEHICADGQEDDDLKKSTVNLCAIGSDKKVNAKRPAVIINWNSAKHHVLTMHYCFEVAHREIATARIWASKNDVSDQKKSEFQAMQGRVRTHLNDEVTRLDAFMSLAMSQLERIRVKYRPSGFFCHVPLVRDAIGLFSKRCTPVSTAESANT